MSNTDHHLTSAILTEMVNSYQNSQIDEAPGAQIKVNYSSYTAQMDVFDP